MKSRTRVGLLGVCLMLWGCGSDATAARGNGSARNPGGSGDPAAPGGTDGTGDPGGADPSGVGSGGGDDPKGSDPAACAGCVTAEAGGGGTAFDPDAKGSNVGLDPDGALVLKVGTGTGSKYIWIANTAQHTVSKVNVETFVEEGRYLLDSGVPGAQGGNFGVDPSRTSVSLQGDAFVGSRGGSALTRISVLGKDCPDTNGDGVVTTATDATFLPWGQDDCVLWQTKLAGKIRGVAAQDSPDVTVVEPQLDGPPKITVTPGEHYVWAGSNNDGASSELWKLDAATGAILIHMTPPTHVYGLAMNGHGILYTTGGPRGGQVGWVDTAQCVDDATCAIAPCMVSCLPGNCPGTCDGAAVGRLNIGGASNDFYGITVDCKQRVWTGSSTSGSVRRYDPSLGPAERLVAVPGTSGVGGLAADRNGWIWASRWDNHDTLRMHAETLAFAVVPSSDAHGIGIDGLGHIWHIPISGNTVTVTNPGPGMMDATNIHTMPGFVGAYTYSDMTGEQLRLASNEPGHYSETFEGCKGDLPTDWKQLTFDADVPMGTWVVFRVRLADTKADLVNEPFIDIAAIPGLSSPLDLETYLKSAKADGKFIEVQVELVTDDIGSPADGCGSDATVGKTPRVKAFGVTHTCMDTVN